ncbi:MAG: hypothetical protein ACP5FH_08880 [Terracidiphilus sp.]
MILPLALSFATALAQMAALAGLGVESFPVNHTAPVVVRILNGKDGQPIAYQHLLLIAGYDSRDLREQTFRQEMLTDARGQVRLSRQMENLPWLQVWVEKQPLCQAHPRQDSFSVGVIRTFGLSAPNRCGTVTAQDVPGVFTVFVAAQGSASNPPCARRQSPAGSAPVSSSPPAAHR